MIRVTIEHDSDCENPLEYGNWKIVSFLRKHSNYEDRDRWLKPLTDEGYGNENFAYFFGKEQIGEAYLLDYYEHGDGAWSLAGEGTQCQWDTSHACGVLIYDSNDGDVPSGTELTTMVDNLLSIYNTWANGACYWYRIERADDEEPEDEDFEEIDSCGGFIGEDDMIAEINRKLEKFPGETVEVVGEADWIAQFHKVVTPPLKTEASQ